MPSLSAADELSTLLAHSHDILTVVDDEGTIAYVSPAVETIFGYEPESRIGRNVFESIHPDDRGAVVERFESLLESPEEVTQPVTYRQRHHDGHWVWLESVAGSHTETAPYGYVVNSRDITERKEHERELAEERQKYEALVEQGTEGVVIVQDSELQFVNQAMSSLTGLPESELLGRSFRDVIAPEYHDLVTRRYEERIHGESPPSRYDIEIVTADGDRRDIDLEVSCIQYRGEPATMATLHDITDRKAYEQRLEEQRDDLDLLNQVLRHDIRNDLQLVTAYADLLTDHVDDEEGEAYLETLRESSEHAVELTQTARDMAEVMLTTAADDQQVSLRKALEREFENVRADYPRAVLSIDDPIPAVSVHADEMLSSVFRNLLKNAVQHNDKSVAEVHVSVADGDDRVVVRIADNGPGVPDDRKERIFGKCEKGLESGGTGIGLYLVQTLVDSYGGEVRVEDNDPAGAVFVVTLQKTT